MSNLPRNILLPSNGLWRIKVRTSNAYLELKTGNAVEVAPLKTIGTTQLWNIAAVPTLNSTVVTYKVTSVDNDLVLTLQKGTGDKYFLVGQVGASTTWTIQPEGSFSGLTPSDETHKGTVVDREDSSKKALLQTKSSDRVYQQWIFEFVGDGFQSKYFTLTPEEALKQGPYDIIIIGSGFGGGVLAADIFENNRRVGSAAQKVLVLEKGNLVFHTNCLNAARPTGDRTGRDQFNHTFYSRFKSNYNVTKGSQDWEGGPVYGVGGRSAIWSLAAPRIHDKTLLQFFPKTVANQLLEKYYQKAERLLSLFLPKTGPEHQLYMDRLNFTADGSLDVVWQWARIASEFRDDQNFDFGRGAFSSIDKLLEIAMNKPVDKDNQRQEHENFKILLGAEAREVLWDKTDSKKAVGVRVNTPNGSFDYPLRANGKVVVSAGSVHSAAILLRSKVDLGKMGGLHITDHNILFKNRTYRYRNPSDRDSVRAMKLQTYLNLLPVKTDVVVSTTENELIRSNAFASEFLPSPYLEVSDSTSRNDSDDKKISLVQYKDLTLVNLYIDSSPFLYRGEATIASNDVPIFIMIYVMRTPLEQGNSITLDENQEPVIHIRRSTYQSEDYQKKLEQMKQFSEDAVKVTQDVLQVDFVPEEPQVEYFDHLGLGAGGHEMGSIPIGLCVDEQLKVKERDNVYVCDLSVFPFVPEANPSLTLTALALRLSQTLTQGIPPKDAEICVVNHTGESIKVSVSTHTEGSDNFVADVPAEFAPGEAKYYPRKAIREFVFVYRLDLTKKGVVPPAYLQNPEFYVGEVNRVLSIN